MMENCRPKINFFVTKHRKKMLFFGFRFFIFSQKNIFSEWPKKYLFSELRIFFGHSFDVKKWDLSIYEVFSMFPALYTPLKPFIIFSSNHNKPWDREPHQICRFSMDFHQDWCDSEGLFGFEEKRINVFWAA